MPTHPPRPRWASPSLLPLALVAALATSCGAGPKPTPQTTAPTRPPAQRPRTVTATLEPWHLPAPVSREVVLAAGTDLLVLGGLDASGTSVATVSCANPATGAVRQVASLDQPTHDAGGAVLGSKDLVVGGGATGVFDSVQAYRGGCAQAGGATTLSGALPRPRADLSVAQGGGTAYVAGGYDGKTLDPAVLATTDGASFRTVGQLPTPVRYAAVAVVGPYLYVIGGKTSSGSDTAAIQRMDTATGTTTVVGQLPAPVDGAEAVVLGGEIWVLGGIVGGHPTNDIVSVDPTTHAVSLAGHLPEAVANAGATVAGGIGWLAGGEGPQALDAVVRVAVS